MSDFIAFSAAEERNAVVEAQSNTTENDFPVPWIAAGGICRSSKPLVRLHNEILQFTKFCSPTDQELNSRAIAIETVKGAVLKVFPDAEVVLFGSQFTDIITPNSDVDLVRS